MNPLALTMGDPAGVGPEITVKAWQAVKDRHPFLLVGSADALRAHVPDAWVEEVDTPARAMEICGRAIPVLPVGLSAPVEPGSPALENAVATQFAIARAAELCRDGTVSAMVTNPISKQVLMDGAGFAFPGHTEYLAHLAGVDRVVMMLAAPALKVVPVTIHVPLADVPAALTADLLEETLRITRAALMRDFGIADPRLAVAGLNPHAGEGGKMGREEIEVIAPVLDRLRAEGFRLAGPLSADTMFHDAARARYDSAVAMYHDQALIPIKTLDFAGGVNCTLGLPFIRTSPDHGTAFDIAGRGRADPSSLIAAIELAARMAANRQTA